MTVVSRAAALAVVLLVARHIGAAAPAPLHRYQATRMSMACLYAIEAYASDPSVLPAALEDAFDEVDRIDRLMSHYKADSPLSRLNGTAANGPVAVEPELFAFIAEALRYGQDSDEAFDITVGPLMKAWGFFRGDGGIPPAETLAAAQRHVGRNHVILDREAGTVRFDEPGVQLDLGGIAKGYAVDRVAARLRARGVAAALISAGGSTLYGIGAPPDTNGWPIDIQDPVDSSKIARVVTLKDRALSIAGSSEKFFEVDGVRYAHIMDPRTGRPVQGVLTVAVLTASGTAGDALDDAFFVLGPERSRAYLKRWPGTEVLFFLPGPGRSWTLAHAGR